MSQRIAVSEGGSRRFDVFESIDGFFVRGADLATGAADDRALKMFRTVTAAFAYAELEASRDRLEASRDAGTIDVDAVTEHHASLRRFEDMRLMLADDGIPASLLEAWTRAEAAAARRHYH